jgi:ketopantoate reductase
LVIKSLVGDFHRANPPTIQAEQLREPFDLVLLSCKAYDLDDAIRSFAPAVGPGTAILPLLNGMRHIDVLEQRFGAKAVLGGQCLISSVMDEQGRIVHLNDTHIPAFGERDGTRSPRATAISQRAFRLTAQRQHPPGDVGEMGIHRDRRGHYLFDARLDRRHRCSRRRGDRDGRPRRMRRRRG